MEADKSGRSLRVTRRRLLIKVPKQVKDIWDKTMIAVPNSSNECLVELFIIYYPYLKVKSKKHCHINVNCKNSIKSTGTNRETDIKSIRQ